MIQINEKRTKHLKMKNKNKKELLTRINIVTVNIVMKNLY